MMTEITLNPADTYALARALVGSDWESVPCSPLTRLILSNMDAHNPDDIKALRHSKEAG
jgi:hypothetical protein